MSMQRRWLLGLVLAVGSAAVLCQADEPRKADADKKEMTAEQKDKALADIARAYQIADAGRKAGSPEALLAAAKILSRLNTDGVMLVKLEGVKPDKGKVGDKPTKGEAIKEEGGTEHNFTAEIKKLKEDAHKLNKVKDKDEQLDALIDKVDTGARGSFRGPSMAGPFIIAPGETRTFHFNFYGNAPANVLVRNKNGVGLKLEIYNELGNQVRGLSGYSDLNAWWTPRMSRPFDVNVSNIGDDEGEIEVYKN
jgi:hypothetical protein